MRRFDTRDRVIEVREFRGTRSEFFRKYPGLKPAIRAPKTPDKEKGELDGSWIWGTGLDEDFTIGDTFESREAAIADAQENCGLEAGAFFQTALLSFVEHQPPTPTDADRLIEDASENLHGEWHEAAVEHWNDAAGERMADLDLRMEKAWDEWIEANGLTIHGYTAEYIESHELGPDPDDAIDRGVAP